MSNKAVGLVLASSAVILWTLTHRFLSLHGDAELYAFQALAKIHTALNKDVYLAFNSQDRYTIFPYIYAFFIAHFTLSGAELGLFLFCTALNLSAAHMLSRTLFGLTVGWLTVALMLMVSGHYGAFDVFSYFEDYLTARSLAVALTGLALALYMCCYRSSAFIVAILAMFIHPIMALPAVLLLVCMRLPVGVSAAAAALCCCGVFAAAFSATTTHAFAHYLPLMDPEWMEVVRERSQFLFLNLWRTADWELTARAFVSLTLASLVATDVRVRKLGLLAMLIGVTGLMIAWIAGSVGPIAILIQGQAWRWTWITTLVAVLLIAPTAVAAWRGSNVGPLASCFLVLGWLLDYSPTINLLLVELALIIWLAKDFISMKIGGVAASQTTRRICQVFVRMVLAAARVAQLFAQPLRAGSAFIQGAVMTLLCAAALWMAHGSILQTGRSAQTLDTNEFSAWQEEIPPTSNVLIVPPPTNAAFLWVALNRPSYISVNQSSGVVFARATALEIRRRSDVLLPIADPDWKILTRIKARDQDKELAVAPIRKLTAEAFAAVCNDPQLGFVIAKEELQYRHFRHDQAGPWHNWNLYDCNQVRPPLQGT